MLEENNLALLSITQAAKELKVGKRRIYQMIDNKEIGIIKFDKDKIKIPKSELIKWVQERIVFKETEVIVSSRKTRKSPAFNINTVMDQILKDKPNE